MKTHLSRLWLFVLLAALLLVPVSVAYAQGPDTGGKVLFSGSYTLASGDVMKGDLIVFGGDAVVEMDATVEGNVVVFGGTADVDGHVEGDATVIGGQLKLGPHAVVEGNAVSIGGSLERHPSAEVEGDIVQGLGIDREDGGITIPGIPQLSFPFDETPQIDVQPPQPRLGGWLAGFFLSGLSAVAWAAILAALGVLMVIFLPRHTERVRETAASNPLLSFGVGLLAIILGIPVIVLLAITICLIPLALALGLALTIAWFFGWLALGWLIGERLLKALKVSQPNPVLEAVVGIVILTLIWRAPLIIPCLGFLVSSVLWLIVGSIGLGAVILTRFGSQPYPTRILPRPSLPPPPLPPSTPALPEPAPLVEMDVMPSPPDLPDTSPPELR